MRRPSRPVERWATLAALLAVAFACLAVVAHDAANGTAWDHSLTGWMMEHRHGWLTTAAITITNAGSPVAMTLLALLATVLLWWRQSSVSSGFVVIATLATASGMSTLTKAVVGAHRPPPSVQLVVEVSPSFPSGHVTGTMALAGMLAIVVGRNRGTATRVFLVCVVAVVTVLIALTRLYLGVHWLSDVLGGALLGSVAVILGSACLSAFLGSGGGDTDRRVASRAATASRVA